MFKSIVFCCRLLNINKALLSRPGLPWKKGIGPGKTWKRPEF